MAKLIETSAFAGLLPLEIGGTSVSEFPVDAITSIAPFKGREAAVSATLKAQMGAGFPAPNRAEGTSAARTVWSGIGQCLALGPSLRPITGAAMTDQTDAWATFVIDGPLARDALARLVPADLRPGVFKVGHAMRTMFGHMNAVILRSDENRYGVMVFRSMARTAAHEIDEALRGVAAREGARPSSPTP